MVTEVQNKVGWLKLTFFGRPVLLVEESGVPGGNANSFMKRFIDVDVIRLVMS